MIGKLIISIAHAFPFGLAGFFIVLLLILLATQVIIEAYGGDLRRRMGWKLYLGILPLMGLLFLTAIMRMLGILF
jgi:hypothetical protein